jgi:hypothetical protein
MKQLMILIAVFWLSVMPAQAQAVTQGADEWYRNHYAPIWKENSWDKLDEAAAHYDKTILVHPPGGDVELVDSRQWLAKSLQEWKSGGWVGSDIAGYEFDQLNPSTAAFKIKWRSWYVEADEDFECSWYLADARGDTWVITQFAMIDCEEHKL